MAKRETSKKDATKELLTGNPSPLGWRDQLPEPQAEKALPTYKRKTYLMTDELIERIERQAESAGVGINEMNRYLLTLALNLVESGEHNLEHDIEVQTVVKRTLGV